MAQTQPGWFAAHDPGQWQESQYCVCPAEGRPCLSKQYTIPNVRVMSDYYSKSWTEDMQILFESVIILPNYQHAKLNATDERIQMIMEWQTFFSLPLVSDPRVFKREVASEGANNNWEVKKGKTANVNMSNQSIL